jgi:putative ABC transport system substrate-binding protein
MRRREFIAGLGAAAWPLVARAQQPAMPVIGFLNGAAPAPYASFVAAFHKGLREAGYVEGQNVAIEYRWAEGQYDLVSAMAADLVSRRVSVIVATGTVAPALAAKAATMTIPIIFGVGGDPVKLGLVASLSRPGGNATGVNFLLAELESKQLGLLHELVPAASRLALLVNQGNPLTESVTKDVTAAASALGLQIDIAQARDGREIEAAFETFVRNRTEALLVGPDGLFLSRRLQLAMLAVRHAIPVLYNVREFVEAGGLVSYGTSQKEAYRQVGVYTARILKGAKPAELPVMQSVRFELVINLVTARVLGLEIPPKLLARADDLIE